MKIRNIEVNVVLGDITSLRVDAYIVPQFDDALSEGGVGGAVMRAGALSGMNAYQEYIDKKGALNFGEGIITKSRGGNSKFLLHVASVGSGMEREFDTVRKAVFFALQLAENHSVSSVATPALGTGIIGDLTDEQSAKAIFSAIDEFSKTGKSVRSVSLVIYGNPKAVACAESVLQSKAYRNVLNETGGREFSLGRWYDEMKSDVEKNKAFFNGQ